MKSKGMKGRPTVGGWNLGLRYGEVVPPEALNGPVRMKGKGCICGTCKTCKERLYSRMYYRNVARLKRARPEKSDEELDANAAKWLETHR